MIDLIGWLVHVLVLLLACAVALGLCVWAVEGICNQIYMLRRTDAKKFIADRAARLESDIRELDVWCRHEFPVLEDVCDYLIGRMAEYPPQGIDSFRERIRAKYLGQSIKCPAPQDSVESIR